MNSILSGNSRFSGFTLIELLVVVAIIAILALIVYPSYEKDVYASRRSDAFAALSTDSQLLERCYTQYFQYNNAACPALVTTSPRGYYTINPTVTPSTYSLTAVPNPTGPQVGDTECASFTLDNTGQKTAINSGGQSTTSVCWTN